MTIGNCFSSTFTSPSPPKGQYGSSPETVFYFKVWDGFIRRRRSNFYEKIETLSESLRRDFPNLRHNVRDQERYPFDSESMVVPVVVPISNPKDAYGTLFGINPSIIHPDYVSTCHTSRFNEMEGAIMKEWGFFSGLKKVLDRNSEEVWNHRKVVLSSWKAFFVKS